MRHLPILRNLAVGLALFASSFAARTASAEATLVVEADSGKVLHAEHATYPWYPASTTKLMTMYLTLKAVKDKRLDMDSLLTVSANAVAQAPSKMGFKAGTQLTVDNALKMMMVKSANDVATATRGGRKLIVVIFGSRSGMVRSEKAAQLFEKGFASGGLSWLMPSLGTVENLQAVAAAPPNLRDEMCGRHRKRPASEEE